MKMKKYILTLPDSLYSTRMREGKLHIIRRNYCNWAKKFEEIDKGVACLSLQFRRGKNNPVEISCLTREDGIGIQRLTFEEDTFFVTSKQGNVIPASATLKELAKNEGINWENWEGYIKYLTKRVHGANTCFPLVLIHFTSFRYDLT